MDRYKPFEKYIVDRPDLPINCVYFEIPVHTEAWFAFRELGIGGSEIGGSVGLNKYQSGVRIFHEKIGDVDLVDITNEAMFHGTLHEEYNLNLWEYWDEEFSKTITNYNNKHKVKKRVEIDGYIVNKLYPWMFHSLDGIIDKGNVNMITGKVMNKFGVLEAKQLSYHAAKGWEYGLPDYYISQVHQYMIGLETDYAEIAILRDGNKFEVVPVEFNEKIANHLINISKKFWYDLVLPSKIAYEKYVKLMNKNKIDEAEEQMAIIHRLEPNPDGTEDYAAFMQEQHISETDVVLKGTKAQMNLVKQDEVCRGLVGKINSRRQLIKNILQRDFNRSHVDIIDFDMVGKVTFKTRKGSDKPTISFMGFKDKPEDFLVQNEMNKLNFNIY